MIPLGQSPSRIMIVGEAPSREDFNRGTAWTGSSGFELSKLLAEVGIPLTDCFATFVTLEYPPHGDPAWLLPQKKKDITPDHVHYRDRYVHPSVPLGIKRLMAEIERCQPNVILALGNVALWALTGKHGVGDWRGSELVSDLPLSRTFKVIPTYHPTTLFKQISLRPVVLADLRRMVRESQSPTFTPINFDITIPSSLAEATLLFEDLLEKLSRGPVKIASDVETRNFNISCVGFGLSERKAFVIPFMIVTGDHHYWNLDEETIVVDYMRRILTHPNTQVVGQNYIYDAQHFYRSYHFVPRFVRDTMLAQHVCFPGMQKSLDFISSLYCDRYSFWKNDSKDWNPAIGERQLWNYNGEDCCRTYECDNTLQTVVDHLGLRQQHDFQQSMFYPVLRTMIRGVRFDDSRRSELVTELRIAQDEANAYITEALGYPLNISSPKQVASCFYEDLGQKPIINRATGTKTTNDEALLKIADAQPLLRPIISKIQELRSLGVFLSTFLGEGKGKYHTGLLDRDGRIRCSYNIAGTITFRFSSDHNAFGTGLNLQNIPKGDEK